MFPDPRRDLYFELRAALLDDGPPSVTAMRDHYLSACAEAQSDCDKAFLLDRAVYWQVELDLARMEGDLFWRMRQDASKRGEN